MGDIDENADLWQHNWDWTDEGDQWSAWWGGTPALWHAALLPRIHAFVPTGTILEIAPGFGRWTQFLKDLCDRLIAVDLTERCIEHCRVRFASSSNIEYIVNDGRSLEGVVDQSVDFAFSFDSLVHVEADVIESYLAELARVLSQDGTAFIHHSNIGSYGPLPRLVRRIPQRALGPLARRGFVPDVFAWRAESVTADGVAAMCERVGLACVSQERISWERGRFLIDTLSLITRRGSRWDRPRVVVDNRSIRREADRVTALWASRPLSDFDRR